MQTKIAIVKKYRIISPLLRLHQFGTHGVFELGGITLAVSTNPQALDRQQVLTSMLRYWSKSGK
jgi:hypothetical protein